MCVEAATGPDQPPPLVSLCQLLHLDGQKWSECDTHTHCTTTHSTATTTTSFSSEPCHEEGVRGHDHFLPYFCYTGYLLCDNSDPAKDRLGNFDFEVLLTYH